MSDKDVSYGGVFIGEIPKVKHTLGPISAFNWDKSKPHEIVLSSLHLQDHIGVLNSYNAAADAARLVACWNAMEGIEDPAAARALIDDPRTAAATDMLDALKFAESYLRNDDSAQGMCVWAVVKNVIAKAEK